MTHHIDHPTAALEDNPRALLDNALQHLRHAGHCAALALLASDDHAVACATVNSDICAASRAVANLIDHLDGYGDAPTVDAAVQRHPAGSAL